MATMTIVIKDEELRGKHFGFMGSGQMAKAIVKGVLKSGVIAGAQITMTDTRGTSFVDHQKYGVTIIQSNPPMVKKSQIVFICVKPDKVQTVLTENMADLSGRLIVSIAAGITIDQLKAWVPTDARLVRLMPNTPCLVGQGAGILARGPGATDYDLALLRRLLADCFPVIEEVPDTLMHAACAVSGSGPAYIYLVAEAMADGGCQAGLPRDLALRLATQTILGASVMLRDTGLHPAVLKDNVCSPGGTTIAAVAALEESGTRAAFMKAVTSAKARGEALSTAAAFAASTNSTNS